MANVSERLMTTKEAAKALGMSASTLAKWRLAGSGPRWAKLGRAVRYLASDLAEFVDGRLRQSTSQPAL